MNAIEILKLDHRVVDALFQQAMDMQPSRRGPVYKKISNELAAHAHIEEAIFYPRLLKEGDKDLKKIVLEGIEEHTQIHMFHDQLDTMKPAEERFEPKLTVLQEDIRHHVKEEENEMFDMVEKQFSSDALERMGEEMEAERKKFQKQKGIPARSAADEALGKGMLSRFVDAVTGMFTSEQNESRSSGSAKRAENGRSAKTSTRSSSAKKASNNGSSQTKSSGKSSASTSSTGKTSSGKTKRSATATSQSKTGVSKSASAGNRSTGRSGTSTRSKKATTSSRSKTAAGSRSSAAK